MKMKSCFRSSSTLPFLKVGAALVHIRSALPCFTRRLIGSSAAEAASQRRQNSKSRARSRLGAEHPFSPIKSIWARLADKLPALPPANLKIGFVPTAAGFRMTVITGHRESEASFFPSSPDILSNPAPQTATPTATGLTLDLKKDESLAANPKELAGLLQLSGGRAYELIAQAGPPKAPKPVPVEKASGNANPASSGNTANPATESPSSARPTPGPGLLQAAGLAFLGGLLLNLMPCVFPVLFFKGLSLVQLRQRRAAQTARPRLRLHRRHPRLVLGAGGAAAGSARRRRHARLGIPIPVAGLSFADGRRCCSSSAFRSPASLKSASPSPAPAARWPQNRAMPAASSPAFWPWSSPRPAPRHSWERPSATRSPKRAAVTFAVFTALALGLAAPYVALTLQPAWTRLLPKPGAWMEVLKQAVSVPIFATVIWLAWVLAAGYGANCSWLCCRAFCCSPLPDGSSAAGPRSAGPPSLPRSFCSVSVAIQCAGAAANSQPRPASTAAADELRVRLAALVSRSRQPLSAQGRPVFVDFTASWCLSCQVNERVALGQPEVQKAFADANVVLLKADWTREDDAITQALTALGRSGVPAYALYVPGESTPTLLPEVLTPGIVTDALAQLPHPATQNASSSSNQQ